MDPDQLASQEPADLDTNCIQIRIYPGIAWSVLTVVPLNKLMKTFEVSLYSIILVHVPFITA